MSFGFSIGDFLAVGKLVAEIITCLQDAGGAKSDYQDLIRELECLGQVLRRLDKLKSQNSNTKSLESIKYAALSCQRPLEGFLVRIRRYEDTLGVRAKQNVFGKSMEANNSMLTTLYQMVCGDISSGLKSLMSMASTVCVTTQQMYGILLEIKSSFHVADARWIWFQEPFKVEDALGIKFPIPAEYNFDLIDAIIKTRFKSGPGSRESPVAADSVWNVKSGLANRPGNANASKILSSKKIANVDASRQNHPAKLTMWATLSSAEDLPYLMRKLAHTKMFAVLSPTMYQLHRLRKIQLNLKMIAPTSNMQKKTSLHTL
ncbi:uncharacterized protein LTHEOB_10000 [Lasiodiplodia theobromae]|uniref:uncharacterized protein n=1 Tax=Lasiodiplodia theobromae TaxID=45133 RepID=UPI0015C2D57B|nr:uncharacterized protein LTHEOB_10000 [Lasiodiplodia theobromae]KAF4539611.1 hypothetical protein LTHEOB_10000 [Lasiodiplodia theobromae]